MAEKNTRGGARPGAGRPKNAEGQRSQHQLRAYEHEWELIKEFSKLVKLNPEKAKEVLSSL